MQTPLLAELFQTKPTSVKSEKVVSDRIEGPSFEMTFRAEGRTMPALPTEPPTGLQQPHQPVQNDTGMSDATMETTEEASTNVQVGRINPASIVNEPVLGRLETTPDTVSQTRPVEVFNDPDLPATEVVVEIPLLDERQTTTDIDAVGRNKPSIPLDEPLVQPINIASLDEPLIQIDEIQLPNGRRGETGSSQHPGFLPEVSTPETDTLTSVGSLNPSLHDVDAPELKPIGPFTGVMKDKQIMDVIPVPLHSDGTQDSANPPNVKPALVTPEPETLRNRDGIVIDADPSTRPKSVDIAQLAHTGEEQTSFPAKPQITEKNLVDAPAPESHNTRFGQMNAHVLPVQNADGRPINFTPLSNGETVLAPENKSVTPPTVLPGSNAIQTDDPLPKPGEQGGRDIIQKPQDSGITSTTKLAISDPVDASTALNQKAQIPAEYNNPLRAKFSEEGNLPLLPPQDTKIANSAPPPIHQIEAVKTSAATFVPPTAPTYGPSTPQAQPFATTPPPLPQPQNPLPTQTANLPIAPQMVVTVGQTQPPKFRDAITAPINKDVPLQSGPLTPTQTTVSEPKLTPIATVLSSAPVNNPLAALQALMSNPAIQPMPRDEVVPRDSADNTGFSALGQNSDALVTQSGRQTVEAQVTRNIAQQLIEMARIAPDRPVEIALNPEELGRVRMTLTTSETGMQVTLVTERPETQDLLRRNIEMLASEFRELGYTAISFSFSSDESGRDSNMTAQHDSDPASYEDPLDHTPLNQDKQQVSLSGGIDLRL